MSSAQPGVPAQVRLRGVEGSCATLDASRRIARLYLLQTIVSDGPSEPTADE
jgi:hypothetical protein